MFAEGQEKFIAKVRIALGDASNVLERKQQAFGDLGNKERLKDLEKIRFRTHEEKHKLLDTLIQEAKPLNLKVVLHDNEQAVARDIGRLVNFKVPEWGSEKSLVSWRHPLIEKLRLSDYLAEQNVPIFYSEPQYASAKQRMELRENITASYIGITSADYCLADTATLVIKTRPGHARSISVLPSIHIAVIKQKQIIADLKELYTLLKWDPEEAAEGLTNCMTLISGPSKTADIEATLVHGAHGPKEVYLYIIREL